MKHSELTGDPYLIDLAERIDSEIESAVEYAQDDSGCEAEYAASFGYGGGELASGGARWDLEVQEQVEWLQANLPDKSFRKVMESVCNLSLQDMWIIDNEVFSHTMGELEHQLDDAIAREVKALSEDQRKAVRTLMHEGHLGNSDCVIYTVGNSDRWVMSVDPDKLGPKYTAIRRSLKSKKPELFPTPAQLRAQFRCHATANPRSLGPNPVRPTLRLLQGGAA